MKNKRISFLINKKNLAWIALSLVCSLPVLHAEETATQEETTLETLTVTASAFGERKTSTAAFGDREVRDTPYSINVLDSSAIEARQSNSLGEAFLGDPSVVTAIHPYASGWNSPIQVRGLELSWDSFRVNGVPSESWGFEWPLEVMEQVELYKGATGFIYGFGDPGGMVNYVTKKPLDTPYSSITAGFRNKSVMSVGGDFSQRAGKDGWLGYRVNLHQEYGETYNGGEIDRIIGTVSLEGRLRDDLTVTADIIYLNRSLENEGAMVGFNQLPGNSLPKPVDGSTEISVDGTYWNIEYTMLNTGLVYDLNPDWKASLLYHFSHLHSDTQKAWAYLQNTDGDYNLNLYQLGGDTDRQYAQAMLQGKFETGKISHQLVTGASALYTRGYSGLYYDWNSIGYGNLYSGRSVTTPFPPHSRETAFSSETLKTDIFVSDTAELLPGLSAIVGLRYNDYDREGGYSKSELTPTYALLYKPLQELTLYTSYMESLEEGGSVGIGYTNAGDILDPMISKQYEIGAKYESSIWSASIAAFRLERGANMDRDNPDGSRTLIQDGIHLYQGIEAQGAVKVTRDLTLSAGAMWLDPTYDKLSDAQSDFEGNRVTGASRVQAVLQASYAIPTVQGLEVHTGVRYYGDTYFDQENTLEFPDYTLLNLGASYATRIYDCPTTFRADISNLTNKKYWSNAGIGTPISAAVSVKVEF
ncbi:MAG: TonB-dependent receptor [Luteolibacter sp.]